MAEGLKQGLKLRRAFGGAILKQTDPREEQSEAWTTGGPPGIAESSVPSSPPDSHYLTDTSLVPTPLVFLGNELRRKGEGVTCSRSRANDCPLHAKPLPKPVSHFLLPDYYQTSLISGSIATYLTLHSYRALVPAAEAPNPPP